MILMDSIFCEATELRNTVQQYVLIHFGDPLKDACSRLLDGLWVQVVYQLIEKAICTANW